MTTRDRFRGFVLFVSLAMSLATVLPSPARAAASSAPSLDAKLFKAMVYRNIGPYRGGRVTAVTGVPGSRETFFMGSTGGGVWKTADAGLTWRSVADEAFRTASMGAIAVAPSDTNVVYAGTGSACIRGNVSSGDGVYRSTDAGETWHRVGLEDAGQIGRIHVDPADADLVYVAALGHAFGPSAQRGVFRSKDGGARWEKVLFVSEEAGAVDLAMTPSNPRILYAAFWRAQRKPWDFISGGEGGGLYKSKDGGDTWERLEEGLPGGITGRIGVSVSGADPDRVWALVEAEKGGLFRSDDGGRHFTLINTDRNLRQRAWYYTHVFADPKDRNTVYVLNTSVWRSDDGGKSFELVRAPHGDHHDLWIDPDDPRVMVNGNDGGANVTTNGGKTWSTQANQPTAEIYRVSVDDRFPYYVYGCQQDNSCVAIPSRTSSGGIGREDWYEIGGCESGHVAIDPRNPEVTYSGCYGGTIGRYDHATGQEREVMAYPQLAVGQAPRDLKYRFQWNAPILLSPHDPGTLYHASQYLLRTTDEGQTWEVISPDLTRNDPDKQGYSGGPITHDNTGVEVYGTIFALAESPIEKGLLWACSDDGLVHLSRDGGRTWNEVTPKGMPPWGQVNMIDASSREAGRALIAVTRYRLDDVRPYIFRTDDYGATWKLLTDGGNGIPDGHFTRVVREDPSRQGLLYAGTEGGMYVSFDDGRKWSSLQLDLPVTPVTDLAITRDDLVLATQGRGFWILDDLTPLREYDSRVASEPAHLFTPRATVRFGRGGGFGGATAAGRNPPSGVMIYYNLAKTPGEGEEVRLEILDEAGRTLRTLSSAVEEPHAPNPFARFMPPGAIAPRKLSAEEGLNRYVWDFRLPDAEMIEDAVIWGTGDGPKVPPGRYQARLTLGGTVQTRAFEITADPRLNATRGDLLAQHELAKKIWSALSESNRAVKRARDLRRQIEDLTRRLTDAGKGEGLDAAARAARERLTAIEEAVHQTKNEASQDALNFQPKLDNQLVALMGVVESADARPTAGSLERYNELRIQVDALLGDLRKAISTEVAAFNDLARARTPEPVIVPQER